MSFDNNCKCVGLTVAVAFHRGGFYQLHDEDRWIGPYSLLIYAAPVDVIYRWPSTFVHTVYIYGLMISGTIFFVCTAY